MRNTSTKDALPATFPRREPGVDVSFERARASVTALYHSIAATVDQHPLIQGLCIFVVTTVGLTAWYHAFNRMVPTKDGWWIYWPFDAITIAFLIMSRRRRWPWIINGFLVAFGRIDLSTGEPKADFAMETACNLLQIIAAAYALPRFRSLNEWMTEPGLFQRFTLWAVVLVPSLSSVPVSLYLNHRYQFGFWNLMMKWGFTDALGIALWTPLVLILFSRETYRLFHWRMLARTIALLGTLGAVCWFTFHQGRYPLGFLPYPVLLLVALRLGFSGAVIGANMLALISASLSLRGYGPFMAIAHRWSDEQTFILQLYSTLAMLFVLPLSVMLIERRNFEEQLRQALSEMEQLATIDKLTGVANRRRFDQVLDLEWERAIRTATPIALLMIDADYFKAYNDCYGHLAGDECLRKIGAILAAEPLRGHDLVARYGGEEFAVLLPGATTHALTRLAERLREAVERANIAHEKNPYGRVTISLGGAFSLPQLRHLPEKLIASADSALYASKQGGRNCVRMADSSPS